MSMHNQNEENFKVLERKKKIKNKKTSFGL